MKMRRILAAVVSAVALVAVNVGIADTASAGTHWGVDGKDQTVKTTRGTHWG